MAASSSSSSITRRFNTLFSEPNGVFWRAFAAAGAGVFVGASSIFCRFAGGASACSELEDDCAVQKSKS